MSTKKEQRAQLIAAGMFADQADSFLFGAEMAAISTTAPNGDVIRAAVHNALTRCQREHVVETEVRPVSKTAVHLDQLEQLAHRLVSGKPVHDIDMGAASGALLGFIDEARKALL